MSSKATAPSAEEIEREVSARQVFRDEYPNLYREHGNVLCPFHDDTNESLQINDRSYYCHAEQKTRNIFDLVGVKHGFKSFNEKRQYLSDRYGLNGNAAAKPKRKLIASYEYVDQQGNVILVVDRYEPKAFSQKRPDPDKPGQWIYNVKGVQLVPYNLPKMIEADTVWIVEGERDADSLIRLDFCATTNVQGAGKWKRQCDDHGIHEWFRRKHVIICPDNDPTGKAHAQQIAESLRGVAASLKILDLPNLPEKGDISDFIETHRDGARQKLLEILQSTPEYRLTLSGVEIISCKDLLQINVPEPIWVVEDLVPQGLGLLGAKPKAGKSWLAQNIGLAVAQGLPALGRFVAHQGTTLCLCLEDNPRRMRSRLEIMLDGSKPPDNHLIACGWPAFDKGGMDQLQRYLELTPDTKLIIIDTYARFRGRKGRSDDVYNSDYSDLAELQSLANLYQTTILLVHHSRKEASDDPLDSILGSTALSAAADFLLILQRKSRAEMDATLHVSGRDVPDAQHALQFHRDTGQWKYLGSPGDLISSAERRKIREVLHQSGKPMGPSEIAEKCGKAKSTIHQTLARMLDAGEVERSVHRGKYLLPPEDELYGHSSQGSDYEQGVFLDHP